MEKGALEMSWKRINLIYDHPKEEHFSSIVIRSRFEFSQIDKHFC